MGSAIAKGFGLMNANTTQTINPQDIQSTKGKAFELRFLPYLETPDGKDVETVIGYTPAWVKRGRGYGRWEEFFCTLDEARARMNFLCASGAIEDCQLSRMSLNSGMCKSLVAEYKDGAPA
jgi:hypothetical protein